MIHELNAQQRAAVDSEAPDLCITAGAGSGKTRVLTERYARCVERMGERALDSVLTITFTDKAAGEIAERVREHLAERPEYAEIARELDSAWISTIHGMCSRILRRHALEAGIDPLFCIGTEVQLAVVRQEAFERVANTALDRGGAVAELFRVFRPELLFERVVHVSEQLRALGVAPSGIERASGSSDSLRRIISQLQMVVADYEQLEKQTETVQKNCAVVREALEHVASVLNGDGDAAAIAATEFKQARTGSQELKDIAERAGETLGRASRHIAQIAVGRLEDSFIGLLEEYDAAYRELKNQRHLMDFEDLQVKTAELFESQPSIAARYAARFATVMIDEFQDTNAMQIRIIEAIAPDGFVTVGDEKQSIYRFRHADVGLFRAKEQTASQTLPLAVNYRSHPELLSFFNTMFGSVPFWPHEYQPLEPKPKSADDAPTTGRSSVAAEQQGARVTALIIDHAACGKDKHADEAGILARHIKELVDSGAQQGDIVVLMRTMRHADTYAAALRAQGLEAFVASGGTYFDRPEVTDLEMLLRAIANPLDGEAFAHVLSGPMTGLSADALGVLRMSAGRGSLWDCAADVPALLDEPDAARLAATVEVLAWARASVGAMGLADLIHEVCERLEYDLALFARGFEGARAWANVLKLARLAEEFEADSPGNPQAFIEHLKLKRTYDAREGLAAFAAENVDAVRIMTVHAAKGLQFPITVAATLGHSFVSNEPIMLSVSDGIASLGMKLPHPRGGKPLPTTGYLAVSSAEAQADLDESKRVFYVACTRAEQALVLCGKTDLSKPAGDLTAIDWVRQTLGMQAGDDVHEGLCTIGESVVEVRVPQPLECETGEEFRPAVDPRTIERACAETHRAGDQPGPVIERISYSGLGRYRACGFRFYATTIARLGDRTVARAEADSPTAFGMAVHAILRLSGVHGLPDGRRVAEVCRAAGLPPERHEEVEALGRRFLRSEVAASVLSGDWVFKELPFAVPVGGIMLDGVIDLISWQGRSAFVLDYKTGHRDERFDPTESYRAQAECYAVAASAMGAQHVSIGFVELENEMALRRFEFSAPEVDLARERIEQSIERIVGGRFERLPRFDVLVCRECPALGNLCPVDDPTATRPAV